MANSKKKNFLKKYASSINNVSGERVWSGRGIGIPVAGAVDGSGDGSKYLGRSPRPMYHGDSGSPSAMADTTFSIYLARVNKDQPADIEYPPMFPDQEEKEHDEDDIYSMISPVVSRKIPKNNMKMKESNKKYKVAFDNDQTVHRSKYSLLSTLDEGIVDTIENLVTTGVGVVPGAGDIAVAIKALGPDAARLALAQSSLHSAASTANISGLESLVKKDSKDPEFLNIVSQVAALDEELKAELRESIESVASAIKRLAISTLSILPDQVVSGPIAAALSLVPVEKLLLGSIAVFADSLETLSSNDQGMSILSGMSELPTDVGSGMSMMGLLGIETDPSEAIIKLGKLYGATTPDENKQALAKTAKSLPGESMKELPSAFIEKAATELFLEVDDLSDLISFISESIYPDYAHYYDAKPTGYAYRDVPTVYDKDLVIDAGEIDMPPKESKSSSVKYRTDDGYMTYSQKSGWEGLDESKKKKY
jgi:hypothetical protein